MQNNRWQSLERVCSEVRDMQGNVSPEYEEQLAVLINKLERIGLLKKNLDEEEHFLKK
jgi:hypothetical protein